MNWQGHDYNVPLPDASAARHNVGPLLNVKIEEWIFIRIGKNLDSIFFFIWMPVSFDLSWLFQLCLTEKGALFLTLFTSSWFLKCCIWLTRANRFNVLLIIIRTFLYVYRSLLFWLTQTWWAQLFIGASTICKKTLVMGIFRCMNLKPTFLNILMRRRSLSMKASVCLCVAWRWSLLNFWKGCRLTHQQIKGT